jgi:hypothetical protein
MKMSPPICLTPLATVRLWRTHGKGVGAVAMALVMPPFSTAVAAEFTLTDVPFPDVAYSSVVCGDLNNDGKPDVLVTGSDSSFEAVCQVWHNESNGVFTPLNAGFTGVSSSAAALGDFDNDGWADLLITGFAGLDSNQRPTYVSQVWRNLGNGTFSNSQAGLPGVNTGAVALGDYDNDGNQDILLSGYSSAGAISQVWRNLGNGTFTNIHAGLPGLFYSSVAWGDYDQDGRLDFLLTGTSNGFADTAVTQLWRNQGDGSFSKINTDFPGIVQGAVAWGDFDQDGWPDILLTGFTVTGAVTQVWRNLGNGTFTHVAVDIPAVHQSSVALGDYDNDGRLDIVLAGVDRQTNLVCEVWRNLGNGTFTNLNAGIQGSRFGSLAWSDFDNDGRLDLLVAGLDSGGNPTLQVYQNNTALSSASMPHIHAFKSLGSAGHQLTFDGDIGFGYTVWASTNLAHWTALGTPNAHGPARFRFTDRRVTDSPSQTYRLTKP